MKRKILEPIDERMKKLKEMIEQLDNFKSSIIRYLEQFRYGSTFLVGLGERSLVEELENQWDMDRIEKGIRNKLDLFDRELSSAEQALLAKQQERLTEEQKEFTKEQSYLNNLILVITVISLGSVTAQILVLPPLNETFPPQATDFYRTQLFIVLVSTAIIILIILFLYSRKLERYRSWRKKMNSNTKQKKTL